jgi:hypothetical protein
MFEGIQFWIAVGVFTLFCALDFLSSWFIIEFLKRKRWSTSIQTFLLQMGAGIGVYQYSHKFCYLIFAALGAALGNFILVTWQKKRDKSLVK